MEYIYHHLMNVVNDRQLFSVKSERKIIENYISVSFLIITLTFLLSSVIVGYVWNIFSIVLTRFVVCFNDKGSYIFSIISKSNEEFSRIYCLKFD